MLYSQGVFKSPARSLYYSVLEFSPKLTTALEINFLLKKDLSPKTKIYFIEHHSAHAASTFFVSPFEEAAIITVDNRGEGVSATLDIGRANNINRIGAIQLPHSLGMVYRAVTTRVLGFGPFDEYKVMGLAAYGQPNYLDIFKEIIQIKPGGKFKINSSYFDFEYQGQLAKKFFDCLGPARRPGEPVTKRHMDIASSLQKVTEEAVINMVNDLYAETKMKNLCLAGGVALNSVMNGRILKEGPFKDIFIQPAANDAGCSLGAAYYLYNQILKKPRSFVMEHAYYGPSFSEGQIKAELELNKVKYQYCKDTTQTAAKLLSEGKIVGWFQGRMEWGPRGLGSRSILADPRDAGMKDKINKYVKHREEFRPFAPSVLEEHCGDYFESSYPSPYMLLVCPVNEDRKSVVPAITHVDGTARVQTVNKKTSPLYYELIQEFYKITGVPVILNTSFNDNTEPIVCTPKEAIKCFYGTGLDYLFMGNFMLSKNSV
jgi:carbamoyltransferase